ncbi:NADH dehydrogenase subunit 1 (mitochondrion) (mitochondrion) [Brachionus plicatilis]|uniref:NADH-ubiquinone oxidoreductase chain 1 n=1 Tax=Brachionus plicatilis TaxID=10195 RepID=A0A3M7P2Y9_BRAPC|nr:NADH dehydrogenase subunit 1 (mitochondrion) [Brachionus plicatilis]
MPTLYMMVNMNYSLVMFFCVGSIMVFSVLRSVAQSISYESVFSTLIVLVLILIMSYSIPETHRAPFDFSESESELVSGFNTEYSVYGSTLFLYAYRIAFFLLINPSHYLFRNRWLPFYEFYFYLNPHYLLSFSMRYANNDFMESPSSCHFNAFRVLCSRSLIMQ